jgi:ribosomal protein S12 methylthiotransferase accessory factor YcaO
VPLDGSPISTFPLPEGWSEPERVQDTVDADGLVLHRVGLASSSGRDQAVGSAADWVTAPVTRTTFELLERIALMEASRSNRVFDLRTKAGKVVGQLPRQAVFMDSPDPARWSYARSSGVALHQDWEGACRSAWHELIERDRVQRAWLGETAPREVPFNVAASPFAKTRSYEWRAYEFPGRPGETFGTEVEVVGLFGLPRTREAPLVFGYGARSGMDDALGAATREAAQLLAFLWGEPIPDRVPEPGPTAMAHLETFQFPGMLAVLRRWLEGGHVRYRADPEGKTSTDSAVVWADVTPPWLHGGLRVARAMCAAAIPLTFGQSPVFAHLPAELQIHPIP